MLRMLRSLTAQTMRGAMQPASAAAAAAAAAAGRVLKVQCQSAAAAAAASQPWRRDDGAAVAIAVVSV